MLAKTQRSPTQKPITSFTTASSKPSTPKDDKNHQKNNRKRLRSTEENYNELDELKTEIKEMLTTMFSAFSSKQDERISVIERHLTQVKTQTSPIIDIEKSVNFMAGQLGDMQKRIDSLETDRSQVKSEILDLEEKLHNGEKNAKKTCIEIRSVPKQQSEKKEDQFKMIKSLLETLEVEYSMSDIRDVYRLPNRNNSSTALVAEFSNTLIKGTILDKARRHNIRQSSNKLSTRHLGLQSSDTLIYISELLTAKSKRLYYLARELAKAEKYEFCWTSHGNIYLRKQAGMPHILVKNEAQLEALKTIT